jgi:hypothetical protein
VSEHRVGVLLSRVLAASLTASPLTSSSHIRVCACVCVCVCACMCVQATKVFHELLDEVAMDVAFDAHWAQKTGISCSLNETVDGECVTE